MSRLIRLLAALAVLVATPLAAQVRDKRPLVMRSKLPFVPKRYKR